MDAHVRVKRQRRPACPKCKTSERVRASRTGYIRLAFEYIHLYPFRCEACLTRFYRFRKSPPIATPKQPDRKHASPSSKALEAS